MVSGKKKCFFCEKDDLDALSVRGRLYDRCLACGGVFMRPEYYLTPDAERDRYALHHNGLENADYRAYLERFLDLAVSYVSRDYPETLPIKTVLDWGSGPIPSLVALLRERGYDARGFDPFFLPDYEPFEGGADLVVCLEVAEHFHDPVGSFAEIARNTRSGGFMAVKTGIVPDIPAFKDFFHTWWYREDPTHVCFYTERALRAIGLRVGLIFSGCAGKDIAVFTKP